MKQYEVTMWIEANGEPEDDPMIVKIVEAENKHEALDRARILVKIESQPHQNAKIWAWTVLNLRSENNNINIPNQQLEQ